MRREGIPWGESHGRGNRVGRSLDGCSQRVNLAGRDACHWPRDAYCADWFPPRIQYGCAHATRSEHRLFVIYGIALAAHFIEFLAKLHEIHDGMRRGGLEDHRAECVLPLVR